MVRACAEEADMICRTPTKRREEQPPNQNEKGRSVGCSYFGRKDVKWKKHGPSSTSAA